MFVRSFAGYYHFCAFLLTMVTLLAYVLVYHGTYTFFLFNKIKDRFFGCTSVDMGT